MKNSIKLFAFVIIGALAAQSCTYEDGPKLTLRTKTSRLARKWKTVKYEDSNGNTQTATDDGSYTEFDKDGSFVNFNGTYNTSSTGKWEFSSDKKNLITTYSYTLGGTTFNSIDTTEITRLTAKELQTKDSDGNKTYAEAL